MTERVDDYLYRPCVGILLLNRQGLAWVGRRNDMIDESWQMPQGGIDKGETPRDAALRELAEEVGTTNVEIIGESRQWLRYDLPEPLFGNIWEGAYRGQRQRWFAMQFIGDDSEIRPTQVAKPEFDSWKWVEVDSLPGLIIAFKRDVYQAVIKEFAELSAAINHH